MNPSRALFAGLGLLLASNNFALAQGVFSGTWIITGAVHAPWEDPKSPMADSDEKRMIGKAVSFEARRVAGPEPIGCNGPKYKVTDAPFDMLFEGGLATPPGTPTAQPDAAAAERSARQLGFRGKAAKTLDAGCTELQFHLVDDDTALFGLNDRVFTMKRKKK
jgi:hypothetical protein